MRILHLYKDYYPVRGGIENHIRLLASLQQRWGCDVTVLVTSQGSRTEEFDDAGVRVIKAGRFATPASTPLSVSFPRWVSRLSADVTHLHFPYPIAELSNLWWGRSARTVITYHSDVVRQKWILRAYEPFLWRVLRAADRIIATNEPYVGSSRYLRHFREKVDVVPLGIPLADFDRADGSRVGEIRRRALGSFPDAEGVLLTVGRLRYYKGLDTLLAAMPRVPAVLLVVGSGPMEREWKSAASRLGVDDRVRFLGEVSDDELPCYYHAADVYVSSASHRSEAFGVSLIEAMACGLPVISTELGTGTSYVNLHGVTGLVVPPRDPAALEKGIRQLLEDKSRRGELAIRARARAHSEFSAEVMVERVDRVYRDTLRKE